MKFFSSILLVLIGTVAYSQIPSFSLGAVNNQFNITCASPAVTVYISSGNFTGTLTSIWSGPAPVSVNGASATIFSPGNYTVKILFQNNSTLIVIPIGFDTAVPTCTNNVSSLITSSNPPPFIFTAISPTANFIHNLYIPNQQSPISSANVTMYHNPPFDAGVYTHCLVNTTSGCSACMTFTFAPPLGVRSNSGNDQHVGVFPNPTNGMIYLKNIDPGITKLQLVNSLGEIVYSDTSINPETAIDLGDQPKGIYLVKLSYKNKRELFLRVIRE